MREWAGEPRCFNGACVLVQLWIIFSVPRLDAGNCIVMKVGISKHVQSAYDRR